MLLEGWLEIVPDIEFIGIYRHPMAVAKSLASRPALPVTVEEGLQMWYEYNTQLIRQYAKKSFPLLCFDWSEEKFHRRLDNLHQFIGLSPIAPEERFYTSELHKQGASDEMNLPENVRELYSLLEDISGSQFLDSSL